MNTQRLKWTIALLALAPVTAWAGQSVDKSWDIDADASVAIDNVAGEIVIQAWNENQAQLTGMLGDSVEELEIDASKSRLQISVRNRNERSGRNRYTDDTMLKLMVPKGASIDAVGVSADISVLGMDNEKLSATSVSGDVEVEAESKWVSIESVSGDVNFAGRTGRISAESVSGDVDLSGISGEISATTVSGDMELEAGLVESAKLETVSGDITMSGEVSGTGRLSAESMSGDVTVLLPAGQSGLFKAQSFSGRISTDFGTVEEADRGPGSYLKYRAGEGAAEIRIESFSGSITLERN
jgi:DUF4097 and DUF4098 domain-containing protein YvlB